MSWHITSLPVALLAICALAAAGPLLAQDGQTQRDKATEILERCSAALLQIKSLECQCSMTLAQEKTDTRPAARHGNAIKLIIHGEKYRQEWHDNLATPAGMPDVIESYDGTSFFHFSKSLDAIAFKTKPVADIPTPYTFGSSYCWAFSPGKLECWNNLLSKETWAEVAKRARPQGVVKDQEISFEVMEFDRKVSADSKVAYRVYFQPELEYFPRKIELLEDGKVTVTTTTVRHAKVKIGDHVLIVPLEVCHRAFANSRVGARVGDYYLTEESFRLQPKIDEKIFTLSTEGISIVQDGDQLPN
jgi:hypothetical protein